MPPVGGKLKVPFLIGELTESFAGRYIERMEPWITSALETFLIAASAPYETILEACEEEGQQGEAGWVPPWGRVFNPKETPYKYLGYLGMYVGVQIPKVATEAEARELVKNESGLSRGTVRSIEEACLRVLGPGEAIIVQERTAESGASAAYHFNILVKAGKVTNALYEAVNAVKPAGVFYSIIEENNIWLQGGKTWAEIGAGKKWSEMLEGTY